nr:type II restriction endonuclease [Escherichia coli]
VDVQGAIGKSFFQKNQIGKLVDLVMPGVVQYTSNKRNTMLISAKTTLRERWQEVPEEVNRTGIREMYLATLDDSFSEETINILYEANVVVVTTIEN